MKKLYRFILLGTLWVLLLMASSIAFAQNDNGRVVKNRKLGISLTLPEKWGAIKQKSFSEKPAGGLATDTCTLQEGKKSADVVTSSSRIHEGLSVEVWRVKKTLKDCFEYSYGPPTLLKKKSNYLYYWSAVEAPSVCFPESDETIQEDYVKFCELWNTRDSVKDSFRFTKPKLK